MDPRRLLTFRAVAHARSFSRAAEQLSLTQPSVSHQIGLLETEVGVRLIDRRPGGLQLTAAGDVLLVHADQVAWRLELADSQIAGLATTRRGQVRLGSFPTALAGYVPAAVARLQLGDDDVRVHLTDVTPSTLEGRFLAGEFDIAVGYQSSDRPRIEYDGARRVDLLSDTFTVGLAPDHPLAADTGPIHLSELADDDWTVPSTDGFLIQACRDAGFEPRIVSVTYDPYATRGIIARGIAVGWVPTLLCNESEGMVLRPVRGLEQRRDVFALLPPGDQHPLAPRVLEALVATAPEFGTA